MVFLVLVVLYQPHGSLIVKQRLMKLFCGWKLGSGFGDSFFFFNYPVVSLCLANSYPIPSRASYRVAPRTVRTYNQVLNIFHQISCRLKLPKNKIKIKKHSIVSPQPSYCPSGLATWALFCVSQWRHNSSYRPYNQFAREVAYCTMDKESCVFKDKVDFRQALDGKWNWKY